MRRFVSGDIIILGICLLLLIESTRVVNAQVQREKEQEGDETQIEPSSDGMSKKWKAFKNNLNANVN